MRFVRPSVVACALAALAPACDSGEPPVAAASDAGHDAHFDFALACEVCRSQGAAQEQLAEVQREKEKLTAQAEWLQLEVDFLKSLQPDARAP
jgi:hypothetical protein